MGFDLFLERLVSAGAISIFFCSKELHECIFKCEGQIWYLRCTPIIMKCFKRLVLAHIKDLNPLRFWPTPFFLQGQQINHLIRVTHTPHPPRKPNTYVRMLFVNSSSSFNSITHINWWTKCRHEVSKPFFVCGSRTFKDLQNHPQRQCLKAASSVHPSTTSSSRIALPPQLHQHLIKSIDDMTRYL